MNVLSSCCFISKFKYFDDKKYEYFVLFLFLYNISTVHIYVPAVLCSTLASFASLSQHAADIKFFISRCL